MRQVDGDAIHAYDSKRGFTLHPDNYGLYFCKDTKTMEVSGRISAQMPLGGFF